MIRPAIVDIQTAMAGRFFICLYLRTTSDTSPEFFAAF